MTTFTYSVTLTGSISQPISFPTERAFQRQGTLVITDQIIDPSGITNGRNILEVGLSADDLLSTIIPDGFGSITFVTNNALVPTRRSNDNVFESFDSQNSILYIQPDRSESADSINMFSSGGSLGIPLQIFDGLMALQFQNNFNTIAGSISFSGTANAAYNATLSGFLV